MVVLSVASPTVVPVAEDGKVAARLSTAVAGGAMMVVHDNLSSGVLGNKSRSSREVEDFSY